MKKNCFTIVILIGTCIFIFMNCNVKNKDIQLDSSLLVSYIEKDGGIKFKKRGEYYICLKSTPIEMQNLGTNKTYTLSFNIEKTYTDTIFTIRAECFNVNKPIGLSWIYLFIKVEHFEGTKTYLLSDSRLSLYIDFSKDKDGPTGKWVITDGYLKMDDFNWQTNKVKGSFYFQFIDTETNEYLLIEDGFINL